MTTTAIDTTSYVEVDKNDSSAIVFTTATEDMKFSAPDEGKFILLVNASASATNEAQVTVKAGDFWRSGLGDEVVLEETDASGASYVCGPMETARFKDEDGDIVIKIENANTGAITIGHYEVAVVVLP